METYLLKTILCSSVFIGFYYLILEKQKAHQFKRFYLLFALLFSMLVPLLTITYGVEKSIENDFVFVENSDVFLVPVEEKTSVFTLENIIYSTYFLVTFVLLIRFLISLNALRKEINSGKKIKKENYFLVLKEEKSIAHSFWKYIFLNKTDYENGTIDEKIIRHEEAHLQQKHSLDVLLIEFLLTIFWFNPAFYLYKKAIITNHEFLADEIVLKRETDIKSYQKLLLTELISERILFTNPFNLSNTKKRIKMMTTPKNNKSKVFSWLSLPLAAVAFFVFVEKVPAQKDEPKSTEKQKIDRAIPLNMENATTEEKEIIKNFEELIKAEEIIKKDTIKPKANKQGVNNPKPLQKKEFAGQINLQKEELPPPPPPPSPTTVDEQATFPGGINAFRTRVVENFNAAVMSGDEGRLSSKISFHIDETGKTSNFSAEGSNETFNQEAIRAMIAANANVLWTPAKIKGKPVSYIFKLPLSMIFEKNPGMKNN